MTFREQLKSFRDVILGVDKSPERIEQLQKLLAQKRRAEAACQYCGKPFDNWMLRFVRRGEQRKFCNRHHSILYFKHGPMLKQVAAMLVFIAVVCHGQPALPSSQIDTNPPATANVTVAWNPSSNPIVAGVHIWFGGKTGVYTNETDAKLATQLTISNLLQTITYYFAATSYSAAGAESAFSSEVSYTVPVPFEPFITNQIFQLYQLTNRLLNVQNPTWGLMFFRMSNGWLCASSKLKPAAWSPITHFAFTNSARLRATNIVQFQMTP
jgi:hypothetical protein